MKNLLILLILVCCSLVLHAETLPVETKAELDHLEYLLSPKTWKLPTDVLAEPNTTRNVFLVFKTKIGEADFRSDGGPGMGTSKDEAHWVYYFPSSDNVRLFSKSSNSYSATGDVWDFPPEWKGNKFDSKTDNTLDFYSRYKTETTYNIIKKDNEVILAQRKLIDTKTGLIIIQELGYRYTTKP